MDLFAASPLAPDTKTTRTCGICKKQLEFSHFYRDGYSANGKHRYRRDCKECFRTTRLQNLGGKLQWTQTIKLSACKMDDRRKQLEDEALYRMMAERDPEMAKLIEEYYA